MNNFNCPRRILITGGVRSGKSSFAERQAKIIGGQIIYLATAEARDEEMAERVKRHQQQRPPEWLTIEAPLDIFTPLLKYQDGYTIILDCLTMYLSNLYFYYESRYSLHEIEETILGKCQELAEMIQNSKANLIIVTNEVGWGIVPENAIARQFRDLAGMANQCIAKACNEVHLLVCGVSLKIKGEPNAEEI